MKRELLSKAFGEIDESYIADACRPVPGDAAGSPERIVHMKKKRIITIALAAALTLALGIGAYAAWSIHTARQDELKTDLKIEENNAESSYVEYDVSEESADGLVLLSAASDGQEQRVYVNISPVTEEEAAGYMDTVWFSCRIEGTWFGGNAVPVLPMGVSIASEEMGAAVLENAYDKDTQTLTLQCFLDVQSVLQAMQTHGTESIPLTVRMYVDGDLARTFGPASFTLTEEQLRVFDFGNVLYHDEELDKDIELVGLDLTPFGAVWKVHYEGDAEIEELKYTDFEACRPWIELTNKVCCEAKIVFSDGTELSTGELNSHYENGAVHLWISWLTAIDIDNVQRIVLGDLVLWEAE